jgi:uncharacterized membrane protein
MTGSTQLSTSEPSAAAASGGPRNPYFAFVPWVAFGVITRYSTVQAGAAAALIGAIAVGIPSFAARRPKLLDLASIVAFAVLLGIAVATDAGHASVLYRYARAIAAATLAVIAFASLLFAPFTEQYARETVPRVLWDTPRFKRTNRRFTAVWGGVFALMAVSHTIAGAIGDTRGETIFNWVIPILLVVRTLSWMSGYREAQQLTR